MVGKYLDVPLEDYPIASAFPLLPEEELKELSKDIEQKGLMNPIRMHEDKILDGRNRYRAIKLMPSWTGKLELHWLELYFGPNPYEYVVSMNCRRRHLTTSQRAFIAADLVNMPSHRPSNNPANLPTYVSQTDAANLFSISERSVRTAKAIKEANLELFEAGKRDEISLNAAYQQIKPDPELDRDANLHLDSHKRTEPSANWRKVSQAEDVQLESPRPWTAPKVDEQQETEILEKMELLNTLWAELRDIIRKIETNQQSIQAGLLKPDEFREKLIYLRDLINNQIENLC